MPYYKANSTMTHFHHKIPRHAGGTNDANNLMELTVDDHAEEHKWLFIEHGRWQDAIAWMRLKGNINNEEMRIMIMRTPEYRAKVSAAVKGKSKSATHAANISVGKKGIATRFGAHTEESNTKRRLAMTGRTPSTQTRKAATAYNQGSIWITNGVTEKKVKSDIPEGWVRGRKNGFGYRVIESL